MVAQVCGNDFEMIEIDGGQSSKPLSRLLPVVEIDGERAFKYFVEPEALRETAGSGSTVPRSARRRPLASCASLLQGRSTCACG